ncbi:signal peptide peptidase SppA [Aliidiomarina shirensis]|uniref:Signal peptide peptidase SppA n=1 Tax=Aliidiomarina shirensis TaxID=1048642 RepID=A0A432WXA7_9GAMM|nr:signal peptide peptidase SppA [Aliidiomarina shirensis]RUO38386.1 signal peptide peptidase SppA [Aliidiomarina shirensis]
MKFLSNLLRPIWIFINGLRRVIVNLVFFILLIGVIVILSQGEDVPTVPEGGLLVLNPSGILVEEATYLSASDRFFNEAVGSSATPETDLHAFLATIDDAAADDRVSGVVLDLRNFWGGGLSKLQMIADRLEKVRAAGKPIIAHGNSFTQSQYFIASQADTVYLNPQGSVAVDGYHMYPTYFSSLLEKLKVTTYIFRVGDFKSAVEPYSRDSMSAEAREANQDWVDAMWAEYLSGITRHREVAPEILSGNMDDFLALFEQADNSQANLALNAGLVDNLAHSEEIRQALIDIGGYDEDKKSFRAIGWRAYKQAVAAERSEENQKANDADEVRVVFASGTILDGYQPTGTVGGATLSNRLRDIRLDDSVKAVVLRIDSPGGSAFASEQIRQELLLLREAGKPVVSSMSSVAASGGYWIAAGTDQIVAPSSVITGSIGVFGMFFSIDESLAEVGVYSDGVSSTDFPYIDITRPLSEPAQRALQGGVDRIYQDFLELVANARGMTTEAVHEVAQGRVWTGTKALELGLIDRIGELDDATAIAAELAGLEEYQVTFPSPELSGFDAFLAELFNGASVLLPESMFTKTPTLTEKAIQRAINEVQAINEFNDPQHVYMRCLECQVK